MCIRDSGMAAVGGLMAQSTYSSTSIADTAAAGNGAPQLFQLYMSKDWDLSLIHISEPTRRYAISYAVFCLKKKKKKNTSHNASQRLTSYSIQH